ncbi:putative bifunctional diguanylate cyclase/phosphodiesterase [Telluria aromaticivorans]|uniref:EAL domain-containing protein n=1 Tax=Telluria aromaticivorans TaxID=2725995 RepID=A0A7Y2JYL8_9BURK|nr:EAL domain-containing protein [Telluria aromaticivorans]NNG23316.1 EAL domain-containing protein [Telluria aromaticivorans]
MSEPPSREPAGSTGDGLSLQRALRAHRTLSASNRTLLRATDETRLLCDMCTVAVEQGGYVRAGVNYAGPGPDRRLHWMVWMGCENGRATAIDVHDLNEAGYTWADTPLGQDATAIAIRTGKPFTRRDVNEGPVFQEPGYEALRRRVEQEGYRSLTAFPLACGDEVIGALFMAAAEPDAFDEQEISLLGELADDLAFGILTLRLRREHELAQETIRRLTLFDTLTGLPNRAGMFQLLRERIAAAHAAGRGLAIVHIGVEKFHEIGNALGMDAVECLMKTLAVRLVASMPQGTPVVMPGEGEFAIVLDDAGLDAAVTCARTALAVHAEPVEASCALIAPHLAAGISLFPDHAVSAESLARRASAAMRLAQRSAEGIAVYPAGHEQEISGRLAMMGRLRQAIEQGQLEMVCQPKVDMRTRSAFGAEALVRWRDPQLGAIAPSVFIPLAEQGGMISAITEWMVHAAFRQVHDWQRDGNPASLSVNLSAHDIQNPAFIDRIHRLALALAIPDNSIQFELTESALMDDPDTAMQSLARLSDMGFEIWIDDFGTGYSSLSYLQRFPIHAIKIDQSFVRLMSVSSGSSAIVHATIDLGHHLGLYVVAEGVEDQAAWSCLAAQGCDVAQGYFVAKPMPVSQFNNWKTSWNKAQPGPGVH